MSFLTLIPTPICDNLPLEQVALALLKENCLQENVILLVEEHKVARQRWLSWGLPREAIDKFKLFNEHTSEKMCADLIKDMKEEKRVFLMSDCGLPAFCDPGQSLVDLCHKHKIKVTATPFPNSIALAVALSGFSHERFTFSGFPPVKEPQRGEWIKEELKRPETLVWMETPYRLTKLLEELHKTQLRRELFLAMDLGAPSEQLLRGSPGLLLKECEGARREFVLLLAPLRS
jgi:16S rRNA (cytidine1402-2'-O)-methyltransferase